MPAAADTELTQVIDEWDEDEEPGNDHGESHASEGAANRAGGLCDCGNVDMDTVCGYRTLKMVTIKDRYLGLLYWGIVTGVIMYIVVVVFFLDGKASEQDTGVGTVITKFKGKGFAGGKVFDEADLRFPVTEPSGAFLMTKRVTVKDQQRGRCVDWDSPRRCPCGEHGQCVGEFCEVQAWCPSVGDHNATSSTFSHPSAQVERILGLENSVLKIRSGISFPAIGNYFFVTGGSAESPYSKYNNITLGELLSMAYPPVLIEEVLERGALIGVSFFWNCDVTTNCEPQAVIKRLDEGQGFVQKRVRRRTLGGTETRDAIYMFGLRILVDSSGIGRRISLSLIVIQVGSGLALLKTASMAADFLMLRLYGPDRREAYRKCKVIESKDYSELQDRLNLIQDEKGKGGQSAPTPRHTAGGAHVMLGLGPGSRGGMPSAALRGRSGTGAM